MFNIKLDLKDAGELLQSPLGAALVSIAFALIFLLVGMSLGSSSKQDVCKQELILMKLQEKQIGDLEIEYSKCINESQTSCIEREQRLCRKDKEEIKENCNKLMEDIFKVGGKND